MVAIHALRRIKGGGRDRTDFEMRCGKGVYVRALARDLGEALGSPAHIDYLRRTAHGPFSEKDAITLQRLTALKEDKKRLLAHLHPLESALQRLTSLNLSKKGALDLREGRRTALPSSARAAEGENASRPSWADAGGHCARFRGRTLLAAHFQSLGELSSGKKFPRAIAQREQNPVEDPMTETGQEGDALRTHQFLWAQDRGCGITRSAGCAFDKAHPQFDGAFSHPQKRITIRAAVL